ncbi:heavy metal-binding domain-containing protein [Flavobacterium sp. LB3P122]
MKNSSTMYACPMHPEVQGKLNDKCPKWNEINGACS